MDDPIQAEAAIALAEASTTRTASVLLDQHHGALRRAIEGVQETARRHDAAEAARLSGELLRHVPLGLHLTTAWRVAVVGAPNVGKSSLINALAGYQRSVVAPTPGTTRDLVTTQLAIDGWPVELIDTAGLRGAAEGIEAEGIGLALDAVRSADLRLWIMDASADPAWPSFAAEQVRLVINKIDLPAAWDLGQAGGATNLSALTGIGIEELCRCLGRWLVPDPPPPGAAVPFTARLAEQIKAVHEHAGVAHFEEIDRICREITCRRS
jgi:tRNA modification GTPase